MREYTMVVIKKEASRAGGGAESAMEQRMQWSDWSREKGKEWNGQEKKGT